MTLPSAAESPRRMWLLVAGYAVGLALLPQLSLLLAPVPVAVYTARGRIRLAWLFVASAFLAGQISAVIGFMSVGVPNALFASAGFVIGWGIRAGRSYRQVTVHATALLFMLMAMLLSSQWDALEKDMSDALAKIEAQVHGSDSAETSETVQANLNTMKWFMEHLRYLVYGNAFGVLLVAMCITATLIFHWLRRTAELQLVGSFREFRPPDALVWFAITAGALWLVNNRWPGETIQFWSWNLAVGVFVWYWLNGLSLLLYAFAAFKPHPAMALFFVAFLLFAGIAFLAVAGMFDTWGNFRKTIDSRAAARKSGDGTA